MLAITYLNYLFKRVGLAIRAKRIKTKRHERGAKMLDVYLDKFNGPKTYGNVYHGASNPNRTNVNPNRNKPVTKIHGRIVDLDKIESCLN